MRRAPRAGVLNSRLSRNAWKVLGIGQLECVLYGIVCSVFYCVDNEKALSARTTIRSMNHALDCADSLLRCVLNIFGIVFLNLCALL